MEKTFTYDIKPVKPFGSTEEIDTGFTGSIQVKIPDYKTRMKLVKEQSTIGDDFEKISVAAYDTCEQHIAHIDLNHEVAGAVGSLEDLTTYQEGVAILFDIYNQVLQGWSLSPKAVKP